MKKLRVGIIGAWGHLEAVVEQIKSMPEVEFSGLARVFPDEQFDWLQQKHPEVAATKVYGDYREMLSVDPPDVAIVSTRLDQISVTACAAARAGCHLICEKPLALELSALEDLWLAVRQNSVQCISMLANRDRPAVCAAMDAVAAGKIGSIALVNVRKSYRWGQRPAWFGRRDIYGGTIPWIGIHALDMLSLVSGKEILTVEGRQGNLAHPEFPDCQDYAALLVGLAGGAAATISLDFLRPAGAPTHGDDWIRAVGSAGQLEAYMDRSPEGVCELLCGAAPPVNLTLGAIGQSFRNYINALRESTRTGVTAETCRAFRLTYLSLCARDAAEQGGRREIDDRYSPAWLARMGRSPVKV